MALQCAVYRNALLLCRITRASLQAGAPVPRLAKPAGRGCSHFVLPQRQMSRLASPAYLSPAATMPKQAYDYFLVLDFEATCSAEKGVPTPQLTGIVQDMVDDQPHLHQVLSRFDDWMREQGLLQARTVFVTFGDWDLQKMLPSQCAYLGIPVPPYMTRWINLKKAFAECTGHWPKTLLDALRFCRLPHLGRHHSGIDDCRNLAQLVAWLASRGYQFA
ncbi:ERI1 exoribonuclease 3 isoform X4 [Rhipicephalus sanguineus]|uniref:ERI1 exoribonuclease 3 isoform X4 n=1 Tax=Rhipicephalus sanguineus TaxID=34632 RepID=UPI001892DB91|nr:ERI1 exoribonuclease 3 isoform X4 [Rhipicephalus sanguineus]